MVKTIDLDDFSGQFCQMGKYPLINTLKTALLQDVPGTPVPETPDPGTTTDPGP